ncbi:MAG: hypothetical protein E7355_04960 [Clostridiales bacterium]|nr:hypothetical protein [Clostridiales bacterium]
MKKTEKIVFAALMVALGVLLIAFQESVVKIAVSAIGILLIALGVIDAINRSFPSAIVKAISGVVVILFGVFAVRAVLYLLAGVLLIAGILILYEGIKSRDYCVSVLQKVVTYLLPVVCILIGILLLFNGGGSVTWVFVVGGILVVVEGGLLLVDALVGD